jgi:hypothetical protein
VIRVAAVVCSCILAALLVACSPPEGRSRTAARPKASPSPTPKPLIPPEQLAAFVGQTPESPFELGALLQGGFTQLSAVDQARLGALAVGPIATDFLGLVLEVQNSSYSVGYRLQGDVVAKLPAETFVSIVHTPKRQKVAVRSSESVGYELFWDGPTAIECVQALNWTCKPAQAPPEDKRFGAEALLYPLVAIVQSPGSFDSQSYETAIVGVPVRCMRGTPTIGIEGVGVIEVCVTGEGVPLKAVLPGITLDGVWYRPSADPAQFTPPAPITGA